MSIVRQVDFQTVGCEYNTRFVNFPINSVLKYFSVVGKVSVKSGSGAAQSILKSSGRVTT